MRKSLNDWSFKLEGEDTGYSLARFLIAFEELRVRLAPSRYPNIEISDEGHLWFNVDTPIGIVEVLAFPFGFSNIQSPSLAVSLPRKAQDLDILFLNNLKETSQRINGATLFTHKKSSTTEEILSAFKQNQHPPLTFTSDFNEILRLKEKDAFFSYLGVCFPVQGKTVCEVEQKIRDTLSMLALE